MGSFKVRLAAYFGLLALLPFAAAFQGFHSLATGNETSRVDAVLNSGLRSSLASFGQELDEAERTAAELARGRSLQRALAAGERRTLARLTSKHPNVLVRTRRLAIGHLPRLAATRRVSVVGDRPLGEIIVAVPLDRRLVRRLESRTGLEPAHRLMFISGARVVADEELSGDRLTLGPGKARTVSLRGSRYRALASEPLPNPKGARLALLTPQGAIDRAVSATERRLQLMMLVALILLVLIAYFEGRSIVRTIVRLVDAAHSIAQGKLDRRVPIKGRDEFARLGRAFNEMADQLEARMRELEDERRRLREATMRFGEALAATHDIDGLLRSIVETAVDSTGAVGGLLVDDEGEIIRKGDPGAGAQRLELPLSAGRETFGTLILGGDNFTSDDHETAKWLVGHGVIALENARLHRTVQRQALVDGLTGLANRRLCQAALEKEISRADRFSEPLSLILADLDDFKLVNDAHGHPTGDEVLREFARILKDCVRDIDLAARWGGEEFAIVAPGTDLDGAAKLAERVRKALRKRIVVAPTGERIVSTASFGIAEFDGAGTADDFLAAADTALYEAKRRGKDRIEPASQSLQGESVEAAG